MEPEAGQAVTTIHTLAPGMFHFKNADTGKINFSYGGKLRGKNSPQVAWRLYQDDSKSIWSVTGGGRMGGVLGENAVELPAGASPCLQNCQAQNRIRGSLPATDPLFAALLRRVCPASERSDHRNLNPPAPTD